MSRFDQLKVASRAIKKQVVTMAYRTKSSHLGPALSISDILTVLYFETMRINPRRPNWPERDYFILSKGHGAAALYATLAERGFFPKQELEAYLTDGGVLAGHPSQDLLRGVEISTGSLGHGLAIGAGLMLGTQINRRLNQAYVLLGDGECDEGSVWEAVKFVGRQKLTNLVAIIDDNKFQGFELNRRFQATDFKKQWSAFGWRVLEVSGHNLAQLSKVLGRAGQLAKAGPVVVLADTVSGQSLGSVAASLAAHYYVIPNETSYRKIIQTIDEE